MSSRFFTQMVSNASKSVASGIVAIGMLLIGFGILILALPELFAILAAFFFFFIGAGFIITALKIYWTQYKINKIMNRQPNDYRENVRIHHEENHYE